MKKIFLFRLILPALACDFCRWKSISIMIHVDWSNQLLTEE